MGRRSGINAPSPRELAPEPRPGPTDPGRVAGGIVTRGANTLDDVVLVVTPAFSEDRVHECRFWMPRPPDSPNICNSDGHPEYVMPQPGDDCLVAFTEEGEPWLPAWKPQP